MEDVGPRGIIIFLLLASTKALNRLICLEKHHDLCFSHDQHIKKVSDRVLFDFNNYPLIKFIETNGEDGSRGAHFVRLCAWFAFPGV